MEKREEFLFNLFFYIFILILICFSHVSFSQILTINNFSISLSFNDIKTNLKIGYDSVISFADPSANFGLILQKNKIQNNLKKNLGIDSSKKSNVINFSEYKKN